MMQAMSRNPGESAEQWNTRASAEYHAAWDAFGVERRRLSATGIADGGSYPALDEAYDGAMDRLEAADSDRGDAAIAVDRERRNSDRAERMRADLDHRMTDEPPADPPRRPVYDDFRDENSTVDWDRFRQAAATWDAAQTGPGSVQDPFNNSPAAE